MNQPAKTIAQKDFKMNDNFWSHYQKLVREVVIPYQYAVLDDKIPEAEKSHAIENFRIAAGDIKGDFYGMVFQDSDVAKWIEAAAYSLINQPDTELEKQVDDLIDLIGRAQQEDGYLNTYFTVKEPEHRWQNLHECHELYCTGHMIEAAVAYYEATGKDKLLTIMKKMSDHIASIFGPDKKRGIPGHPEIELALMRLYKATGDENYRNLAEYFVNERGTEPNFFEVETKERGWEHFPMNAQDRMYAQNHAPVREQKSAEGHAVRAVYLYTGMAAIASETGDESLLDACKTLWRNIVDKRMYVTGGIGSNVHGEAFTFDYDLPNDTTYAETCAAVGLVFFAQKMLTLEPMSEYADVMEKALYNGVLAGMQLDGKKFFYVNPLEVNPGISGKLNGHRHVLPERPSWFGCACCPPNVARLLSSLGRYAWTESEDVIYSHLYISGEADFSSTKGCRINVETNYPWEGDVKYQVISDSDAKETTLAIRVPGWCDNYSLLINGEELSCEPLMKDGYIYITRRFSERDSIILKLQIEPVKTYANSSVNEDAGRVAIERGPLVYCFEGVDNGDELQAVRVAKDGTMKDLEFDKTLLGGVVPVSAEGFKMVSEQSLYSRKRPVAKPVNLKAVPYYTWGNRGLNQMRVWLPEE